MMFQCLWCWQIRWAMPLHTCLISLCVCCPCLCSHWHHTCICSAGMLWIESCNGAYCILKTVSKQPCPFLRPPASGGWSPCAVLAEPAEDVMADQRSVALITLKWPPSCAGFLISKRLQSRVRGVLGKSQQHHSEPGMLMMQDAG